MSESKFGKYIVTDLKSPYDAEFNAAYAKWATRVLWIDDKVVEGAFQMNVSWYLKPQTGQEPLPAHSHDESEIIGFFGNNHEDPHDLGGEVEFWFEDEKHLITRSCLIFVPANITHCPLILKRVDRPIFHFSTVISSEYVMKGVDE
jgi:hypothetical protein